MNNKLDEIILGYSNKYENKQFNNTKINEDLLMQIHNITEHDKRKNMQYWGRELGMEWQKLVVEIFQNNVPNDFGGPIRNGDDEPCDLRFKNYAIDTKYRCGSGDSGTLKKFKQYGKFFKDNDMIPLILLFRTDNLSAAITALRKGGWIIKQGDEAFDFIFENTGFDVKKYLESKLNK